MRPILFAGLALAACSGQPAGNLAQENAAAPANTMATAQPIPSDAATPAPPPVEPAEPGTPGGLDDDRTPVSEAPFTPESAQGAAQVMQTYYALIEAGKYGQAYRLWEPGAAGMSARAFADSFAKYREYHAQIGAPGRVDAGAGQRYVTVPVQVYGRLKAGNRAFDMRGQATLHRTADFDGATAEQKSWHIRSIDIGPDSGTPAPSPEPTVDNRSRAVYRCADGSRLVAAFDPDSRRVTVRHGGERVVLPQQRSGSGIRYGNDRYSFRGKGDALTFEAPGKPALSCTVRR